MNIKGNSLGNLPTLLGRTIKTCSRGGVGVLGVRYEFIEGVSQFSLDKVETHPTHPRGSMWSHNRDINMMAFSDRLVYNIPIYTEQDRLGFHTLSLSIATPEYIVPK